MHRYDINSPESAVQLLAHLMLADGMAGAAEMAALERHAPQLGLSVERVRHLVQALCEEHLQFSDSTWCAGPSHDRGEDLIAAITDPTLRRQVLAIAVEVVQADRHVSEGEGVLLQRIQRRWAPESNLIAA